MVLTKDIVLAVEEGVRALRSRAHNLATCELAKDESASGLAVRVGAEADRQRADMLAGWAVRAREEVGMPPQEM